MDLFQTRENCKSSLRLYVPRLDFIAGDCYSRPSLHSGFLNGVCETKTRLEAATESKTVVCRRDSTKERAASLNGAAVKAAPATTPVASAGPVCDMEIIWFG